MNIRMPELTLKIRSTKWDNSFVQVVNQALFDAGWSHLHPATKTMDQLFESEPFRRPYSLKQLEVDFRSRKEFVTQYWRGDQDLYLSTKYDGPVLEVDISYSAGNEVVDIENALAVCAHIVSAAPQLFSCGGISSVLFIYE